MKPDTFQCAMIDRHEAGHGAVLQGHRARGVGAPPLMGPLGRDGAVMRSRPHGPRGAARGRAASLPHQPEPPELGGPDAGHAQARPALAGPFAQKRRRGEPLPDVVGQGLIRVRRLRPPLGRLAGWPLGTAPLVRARRPGHAPLLAHPVHTKATLLGRRRGVAHRVDRPATQGRPPRRRWTASRASARRLVRSPTKAFNRANSSSRPSAARLFRPAWPLARNWSRQSERVAAVTPSSRETRSSSSPRSTCNTASTFLREEKRPRSAFNLAMDTSFNEGQDAPNQGPKKSWGGGA
jgi:hypothetical protein